MFQRMIRFLVVCLTILFCLPLAGQQDRFAVHFDKAFYTTGEIIWFTIYPPASGPLSLPGMLRIAIYDPGGAEVHHFHLRQPETGSADGYIRIPYDWPGGKYRFTIQCPGYPNDRSSTLLNIPIYNDLEPAGTVIKDVQAELDNPATRGAGEEQLVVSVQLDRRLYRPGDFVEATITVKNQKGKPAPAGLSVAVKDRELLDEVLPGQSSLRFFNPDQAECSTSETTMIFQGQVQDSTGAPRRTYSLSAYLPVLDTFLYTQTDTEGRFSLPLPDFYGNAVIQFTDYLDNRIRIEPVIPSRMPPTEALTYTGPVIEYLRLSQQRKKIYQLYESLEIFVEPEIPTREKTFGEPDRVIRLSDYEPFPDIPTLFRELLTPLKFRKENGRPVAHMYNPDTRQPYRNDPIFLIDGQLTWNADYIAGLDINQIEEIALYYEASKLSKQFGRLGLGGVAVLKTKGAPIVMPASVAANRFDITGLQPPAVFPTAVQGEQPVFRPLVFWEGNLRTNPAGKARIKFPHTDDLSSFRIEVTARDKEGRMGFGAGEYRVENRKP